MAKQFVRLVIEGDSNTIKAVQKATDTVFFALKAEHPGLKFDWEDCGYTDDVGGHHDAGVGWAPDGHYCGECCSDTCETCNVWEYRCNSKAFSEGNRFLATMKARIRKYNANLSRVQL